jgi:hypothetical protein
MAITPRAGTISGMPEPRRDSSQGRMVVANDSTINSNKSVMQWQDLRVSSEEYAWSESSRCPTPGHTAAGGREWPHGDWLEHGFECDRHRTLTIAA